MPPRRRVRSIVLAVAVLLALVGLEGPAHAAPINQPCGSSVTASFEQSVSKTCAGNWITVVSPGVVVDLGGNTITDSLTTGTGVTLLGEQDTVRNGRLDNFDFGVVSAGDKNVVEGIRATNGAKGIATQGAGTVLRGNIAELNNFGFVFQSGSVTATSNLAVGNGQGFGTAADPVSGKVDGNMAVRNTTGFVSDFPKLVLSHDVALGNGGNGFIFTGEKTKVVGNIAHDNGQNGFDILSTAAGVSLIDNVAHRNAGRGFQLNTSPAPKAKGNLATQNGSPCNPAGMCAPTGNPLPPDNPPCGATIMQSFQLSGDRPCASQDGWTVGADKITIDLGDHILSFSGTGSHTGILDDHAGVTIRNGTINGFASGITLGSASSKALVEGVVLKGNGNGLSNGGIGNTVRGNLASLGNGGFATTTGGGKLLFARNVSLSPGNVGFYADPNSCCVTLDTNAVGPDPTKTTDPLGSGSSGFLIQGTKSVLARNAAVYSDAHGFRLGNSPAKVTSNYAFYNGADGFDITGTLAGWALTSNVAVRSGFTSDVDVANGVGLGFELDPFAPPPKAKGNLALLSDNPANCSSQMTC